MISPNKLFSEKYTLKKVLRTTAYLKPENLRCSSKM